MKFGMVVLQVRVDGQSWISDMTSYFQGGGHDIISRKSL